MKKQVGVIGPSNSNLPRDGALKERMLRYAEEIGKLLAHNQAIVITGGQDGVMEAVCKGAKELGGITVGTPGRKRFCCNNYVEVEICTPVDIGDYLFAGVPSCDTIIAFPGGAGTMTEIGMAYRLKIPVIIVLGFDNRWDNLVGSSLDQTESIKFEGATTPEEAVNKALLLARIQGDGLETCGFSP